MSALSLALFALATIQPAEAGRGGSRAPADLAVSIDLPTFDVDQAGTVFVDVDNVGGSSANDVVITVAFPTTNTSPTVHVLGTTSNIDSSCFDDGTQIKCFVGRVKAGKSTSISFDIELPQSADDIEFYAAVGTSSTDGNSANNQVSDIADVLYPDLVITSQVDIENRHCTGQDLVSFFECELYPSSISSHLITFETDNTITFAYAGYAGVWSQPTDDSLHFEYWYAGQMRLEFDGNAVDGSCFEGLSDFPGTGYVAPYQVCIQ